MAISKNPDIIDKYLFSFLAINSKQQGKTKMAKRKFTSLDESMLKTDVDLLPKKETSEKHFGLTVKLHPTLYKRLINAKIEMRGSSNQSIMVMALEEWLDKNK